MTGNQSKLEENGCDNYFVTRHREYQQPMTFFKNQEVNKVTGYS